MKHRLFVISLLTLLVSFAADADTFSYTYEGHTLNYTTDDRYSTCYVSQTSGITGDVIIPERAMAGPTNYQFAVDVVGIGKNAFWACSGLTSVTIPNSVTSIGEGAFGGCSGLTSINIPGSVTSIGNYAFQHCSGLTSVSVPSSITAIGNCVFQYCSGLTSLSIPNSVTSIGNEAFWGCTGLTSLTIPSSVTSIGESAFRACSGLTSLSIPNSVSLIGKHSFEDCSGLTALTLSGDFEIGWDAFRDCTGLAELSLSGKISLKDGAFSGCTGLTSMSFSGSISIGFAAFSGCTGLISLAPSNVTSIGSQAFANCTNLTSFTLPKDIESIEGDIFYNCSALEEFKVPKDVKCFGMAGYIGFSTETSLSTASITLNPKTYLKVINDAGNVVSLKDAAVIANEYDYEWNGNTVNFRNLHPHQRVTIEALGASFWADTDGIRIDITQVEEFADVISFEASFNGESFVNDYYWYYGGGTKIHQKRTSIPYGERRPTFYVEGSWGNESKGLPELHYPTPSFTDVEAVATATTKARLMSKCNLSTGALALIEWRRYDAPDAVKSNVETCPVVNGVLMGELRGLKDDVYYKFRPLYERNGQKFYGEWVGIFTGDAGVYFEPEVGTLPAEVTGNSAGLEGYAYPGTDDVDSRGIEYRLANGAASVSDRNRSESEWIRVASTANTFFKVQLDNLDYESEYEYRAYAVAGNNTYYGEIAGFRTGSNPSGVEDMVCGPVGGMEISLLRNPVVGNPIIMVSGNGESVQCFVHSMAGALLKTFPAVADGTPQEIEMNLNPGMYILTAVGSSGSASTKMIVR